MILMNCFVFEFVLFADTIQKENQTKNGLILEQVLYGIKTIQVKVSGAKNKYLNVQFGLFHFLI